MDIHWIESGAGETVVLLHGLGGDIGFWEADVPALAQHFRVIAIDLRGSGGTPSTGGHTITDLADDVAAVLDEAGVDRAHIVGFSMGGTVAQEFAVRHPERVARLVLSCTFAMVNNQAGLFLDAVLEVYQNGASARQMFDLISPWLFSTDFVTDPANAAWFVLSEEDADDQTMEDWRYLYRAMRQFDGRARLRDIQAATLVIAGGQDNLASIADATALADGIPDARLELFAGAGHLVNVEVPEAFRAAVIGFLLDRPPYAR